MTAGFLTKRLSKTEQLFIFYSKNIHQKGIEIRQNAQERKENYGF
jgi:hypothetical protein